MTAFRSKADIKLGLVKRAANDPKPPVRIGTLLPISLHRSLQGGLVNLCHSANSIIVLAACAVIGACSQEPNFAIVDPSSGLLSESLLITSQGVIDSATAHNNELSEYNDATIILFIQNLHSGKPVVAIAPNGHTGNYRSKIELPDGWELNTPVVPGGGCKLQPVHLYNDGKGGYSLSVMTMSIYGACPWLIGEYAYRLAIETDRYSGGTVGKILVR